MPSNFTVGIETETAYIYNRDMEKYIQYQDGSLKTFASTAIKATHVQNYWTPSTLIANTNCTLSYETGSIIKVMTGSDAARFLRLRLLVISPDNLPSSIFHYWEHRIEEPNKVTTLQINNPGKDCSLSPIQSMFISYIISQGKESTVSVVG